jgi:hypothetical protein
MLRITTITHWRGTEILLELKSMVTLPHPLTFRGLLQFETKLMCHIATILYKASADCELTVCEISSTLAQQCHSNSTMSYTVARTHALLDHYNTYYLPCMHSNGYMMYIRV